VTQPKPLIHVWPTECEVPAIVICIELEASKVKIGYNVAGTRASWQLTVWLHSQPELLELYQQAFSLSRAETTATIQTQDVPSVFFLIKLDDPAPELGMSDSGWDSQGQLREWLYGSRPELGELFQHAVRLSNDVPFEFDPDA
jgi:hypothetical protein